ncbi:MAG: hypothetical protein ACPGAG_04515 [Paracoccaceae bacterium]
MVTPPPLKNDCFALPPGVDWTPVDDALAQLKSALRCVVSTETVDISKARDRFVAQDVIAPRASPPKANSAVDGYGFAGSLANEEEVIRLALHPERAAAGVPMQSAVAEGQAVRILTGAQLPEGCGYRCSARGCCHRWSRGCVPWAFEIGGKHPKSRRGCATCECYVDNRSKVAGH